MARLLIFDSHASVDAKGAAVSMGLVKDTYVYSKPVRLYGAPDGAIQDVGYEFLWESNVLLSSAAVYYCYWYQEFMNDTPTRRLPTQRSHGVTPTYNWAREQMQLISPTPISATSHIAEIQHYDIRRKFSLDVAAGGNRSVYFPVSNHALYARLAITISSTSTEFDNAANNASNFRLRAWAIVGGHDQQDALEDQAAVYDGDVP